MSEKHFVLVCDTNLEWLMQDKLLLPIIQKDNNQQISLRQCCILLNELAKENEQLKFDNFNLTKTVEYLDETVKEQCNKIAWADECGVRWNKEYHEWMGDVE